MRFGLDAAWLAHACIIFYIVPKPHIITWIYWFWSQLIDVVYLIVLRDYPVVTILEYDSTFLPVHLVTRVS